MKLYRNCSTLLQLERHESCGYDYVEVRDGDSPDSPFIGKYCGDQLPPTLVSSGNTLLIKFNTDHSKQWAGFSAVYSKGIILITNIYF